MKRVQSIGILLMVAAVLAGTVWAYAWYRTAQRNVQCARSLEQIGAAVLTYVNESEGEYYPPLSLVPGRLMFDRDAVYPTYLTEPSWLVSPFHPDFASRKAENSDPESLIDDASYWYLGYVFANERSALAWIGEYKEVVPAGRLPANVNNLWPEYVVDYEARKEANEAHYEAEMAKLQAEWIANGGSGERPIKWGPWTPHLLHELHVCQEFRDGVERFLVLDIGNPLAALNKKSEIPVMVERPELHGDGGHVLYMDGHVEFVPYPGPFPMTVAFIDGLRSLDRLGSS